MLAKPCERQQNKHFLGDIISGVRAAVMASFTAYLRKPSLSTETVFPDSSASPHSFLPFASSSLHHPEPLNV